MPWFNLSFSDFIKKRVCKFLINRYLGQFFEEKLTADQICLDLYNGLGSVYNVNLCCEVSTCTRSESAMKVVKQWVKRITDDYSAHIQTLLVIVAVRSKNLFFFCDFICSLVCCLQPTRLRLYASKKKKSNHIPWIGGTKNDISTQPASDLVKIVLWQLIKLEQRKVKFFSHIAMARTYTHPTHLISSLGHANHSSFRPHTGFASSSMQRVYDLVASSRTYMYGRLEKSCFASCFESLQVNGSIISFRFTSSFSLRHPLTCFSVRQNSRVGECM